MPPHIHIKESREQGSFAHTTPPPPSPLFVMSHTPRLLPLTYMMQMHCLPRGTLPHPVRAVLFAPSPSTTSLPCSPLPYCHVAPHLILSAALPALLLALSPSSAPAACCSRFPTNRPCAWLPNELPRLVLVC